MESKEVLQAIAEFFQRYGVATLVVLLALGINAFRIRSWWLRTRAILDPSQTPEWSSRSTSWLRGRATGQWQGRSVMARRLGRRERSHDRLEVSMEALSSGALSIERGDLGVLNRAIRLGGPPRIEPMRPEDQKRFRVFADDQSQAERLLGDAAVRDLLDANLVVSGDELSLRKGKLRVVRRVHAGDAAERAVQSAWRLVQAASRVVG